MLSRALNTKPRSFRFAEGSCRSSSSLSLYDYDDIFIGCVEDMQLVACGGGNQENGDFRWALKDVMRASVGVVGESALGVTEKVVFLDGRCCVLKRFRVVCVRRKDFGRRIGQLAMIGRQCDYLVPINAYLYSKRFKFVVCDYYPMGSLADLLVGARELGQTALNWKQRLKIIFDIARAIAFIHSQSPSQDKNMIMNVHGNLKTSNIMIGVDFSAHLSNYGFCQLAVEVSDTGQRKSQSPLLTPPPKNILCEPLSQEGDIYHFGIVLLDMLGGPKALESTKWCFGWKEEIKNKENEFFEFPFEGKEKRQVLKVLDMAMACLNRSFQARPSIQDILMYLGIK